jgi:long-chain acyl-CoA synthetase
MENIPEPKLFTDYLYENEQQHAGMIYLRQPIHGIYHEITWAQVMLRARKITNFLKQQGLQKGDRVALFSKNCAEWFIADFAIVMAGLISVPLFATQPKETIKYILEHAEVKLIFVGKLDDWTEQEQGIPEKITRVSFPYENAMPAAYKWNDILEQYPPEKENYRPDPQDIYTITYTSGTTGFPKGVMFSFLGLSYQVQATQQEIEQEKFIILEHNHFLSYLPLAHVYERLAIENLSLYKKSTITFTQSLQTFIKDLQNASPTFFIAVPRMWTLFQMQIINVLPQHKLDRLLKIPLISFLVKRKIKKALGLLRSKSHISGSAPISPALLTWYQKLGIDIYEGYGMTENLAWTSLSTPTENKIGTVGKARLGVELKLGEDNEVLVKSKIIMVGYYKDPEATKAAFTEDGFLHTGDRGEIDADGFLTIRGRVKDTFKTDKGEFIDPAPIENKFAINTNIEQLCLMGLYLPQPVLLVNLSEQAKARNAKTVKKELQSTLDTVNQQLPKYSKVARVLVVKDHWTPENGFLTPTLKVKRNAIMDRYLEQAQALMMKDETVSWE